ncbi:MAG: hypothetical protein LBQ60_18110 [Bacteroidales bacterium]|jgi:hypothetical protein|nr:hypothetical protein [Bacteroidales bacterium]
MKKILMLFIGSALFVGNAFSQHAGDALLFSQYFSGGTARSSAMSGAFGALGGDLSTLSTNPAGLGVYRGSEFTFTPALSFTRNNASFLHTDFKEKNTRFRINNVGYVYTWNFHKPKGVQSLTFGVAYNRLADFSSDAYVNTVVESSLLDEFVWRTNDGRIDSWYEQLAMNTLTVWKPSGETQYINDYIDNGSVYNQELKRTMGYRGGIGEYAISLGTNISNQFYMGATWGIHDVHYEEFYDHLEFPGYDILDYFVFKSDYVINGWGMNFKVGAIYRPFNFLRLGASVHTPTHYWLRPELATEMEAFFNQAPNAEKPNDDYYWAESPIGERKYRMTTPWRYNASAALVLGSYGILSFDAEFVDYSKAEMLPNADFGAINNDVSDIYKNVVNLKGGAEVRLGNISLRGGVAYYPTAFKNDYFDNTEFKNKGTISYSGGLGFRVRNFYMDGAYVYTQYPKRFYDMYEPAPNVIISPVLQNTNHKVMVTVGFKF